MSTQLETLIAFVHKQVLPILFSLLFVFCLFSDHAVAEGITHSQLQEINQLWQQSAHAQADVNCSSCHQDDKQALVVQPTFESCQSCHELAVDTFLYGKHGVRLREGLSPLTPAMAHLPMKESATAKEMTCNACHNVHSVDTLQASVDSCLTCHNDAHSLNYRQSKHAEMFAAAKSGLVRPSAESVTCATCHLPRIHPGEVTLVNHNNTFLSEPRDRMVKEVCMNCHGVEYSFDSIFDDELVEANFARPPNQKLETFDLIRQLEKKRSSKATQN